jgi:CBS domain containing-hemolysin-like protein
MSAAILIVAIVALAFGAWLRLAGSALTKVPRADALRDAADDVTGAGKVARLLEERDDITPAVAMAGSAMLLVAAVAGTVLVVAGQPMGTAVGYAALVFLFVFLIGDLIPRQLGRRRSQPIAYRSAGLLEIAVALGGWATDLISDTNGEGSEAEQADPEVDTEHERELIDSVLDFGDTVVREVMTPRPDMVTVPVTATVEELIGVATEEGYSRIPVTSNGDVVGMVMVKDLLLPLLGDGRRPSSVAEVMRPVEFVPETKLASALLGEMRSNHEHQMIVVDEYGDVAGLVTIEDLLEELVGEITDETDEEETFVSRRPDGGWDVDGRLPVDELSRLTGVDVPDEDWDTVAGLVMGLAERVPEEGEQFDHGPLRLTVSRMQGRRVADVSVSVTEAVDAE